mmetsp:Transcript_5214/g.7354  ORF Transcript_5214/g.7354 Transcript_5214/m.7354 type:complete len:82 (-) Transcript_5214:6-251(-)
MGSSGTCRKNDDQGDVLVPWNISHCYLNRRQEDWLIALFHLDDKLAKNACNVFDPAQPVDLLYPILALDFPWFDDQTALDY